MYLLGPASIWHWQKLNWCGAGNFTGRYYLHFTSKFVILVRLKTEQCVPVIHNSKFILAENIYDVSLFGYISCCMCNSVDS